MKIAVVGLGYVGLPLAYALSKKYDVIGFDVNKSKIESYQKGVDVTGEVGDQIKNSKIKFSCNEKELIDRDFVIIAVPTPVDQNNKPDFLPLVNASKLVATNMKQNAIVVYESTVYPGATEEVCIPVLEEYSGKKCGRDFKVGYSPERINPGDKINTLETIVKIVSATDDNALEKIADVYASIISAGIFKASSIKVAEASKVIENTQRDINIAFINEIAMLFKKLGINTNEVLEAANTKWNFLNFKQGLVGGHCIGVDPFYLIEKANQISFDTKLIKSARRVNEDVPYFIVDLIEEELRKKNTSINNSTIAIMGITFKENVPDTRNSKVFTIIETLKSKGANVLICDNVAEKTNYNLVNLDNIKNADVVVFAVAHNEFKKLSAKKIKSMFKTGSNTLFDLKNIFPTNYFENQNINKINF